MALLSRKRHNLRCDEHLAAEIKRPHRLKETHMSAVLSYQTYVYIKHACLPNMFPSFFLFPYSLKCSYFVFSNLSTVNSLLYVTHHSGCSLLQSLASLHHIPGGDCECQRRRQHILVLSPPPPRMVVSLRTRGEPSSLPPVALLRLFQ